MSSDITIQNLCVSFGNKKVLRGLNLTIQSPGVTCLIGPNGSGKTTLIRTLMNFIRYDGEIIFGDKKLQDVRQKVALVLDEPPFYGNISVKANLDLLMDIDKADKERLQRVFAELNIDSEMLKTRADKLSFGQRHRVAVAGAVLRDPKYIFLDEPSVGMDPESFSNLVDCLRDEVNRGKCILVTGHDFELVDLIADKVAVLSQGICSFYGTKEELKAAVSADSKKETVINRQEFNSLFKAGGSDDE